MLQAAHGVHHITAVHPSRRRVVGPAQKKGETEKQGEIKKKHSLQDHLTATITIYLLETTFTRPLTATTTTN